MNKEIKTKLIEAINEARKASLDIAIKNTANAIVGQLTYAEQQSAQNRVNAQVNIKNQLAILENIVAQPPVTLEQVFGKEDK